MRLRSERERAGPQSGGSNAETHQSKHGTKQSRRSEAGEGRERKMDEAAPRERSVFVGSC